MVACAVPLCPSRLVDPGSGTLSETSIAFLDAGDAQWAAIEDGTILFNTVCTHDIEEDDDDNSVCDIDPGTHFSTTGTVAWSPTTSPTTERVAVAPSLSPTFSPTLRPSLTVVSPPAPTSAAVVGTECTSTASGAALAGIDVVAFHNLRPGSSALRGNVHHSETYQGYSFNFVDADNAALFAADPAHFVPMW